MIKQQRPSTISRWDNTTPVQPIQIYGLTTTTAILQTRQSTQEMYSAVEMRTQKEMRFATTVQEELAKMIAQDV